jgi:glycosyltransferase involved in cell wall biosynthesis
LIPNYIAPENFACVERANATLTIGRLSRPDPVKYPADFPVFYEELGLKEVTYRVQAWSDELRKIYRWHTFGPEWELLAANKVPAERFLQSLDLFVYPLGHRVVESWGRSTVEAMLTGCVPLVPAGHHFHQLMEHEKSGFICSSFAEYKHYAQALYRDSQLRRQMGRQAAQHARSILCNRDLHQAMWIQALTF